MAGLEVILAQSEIGWRSKLHRQWGALRSFMGLPLLIILGLTGLGFLILSLDRNAQGWLSALRSSIQSRYFVSGDSTSQFLGTVIGGMFTEVSIIITMLLLVLQQTASNMGNFIYDQFLHRYENQAFAGYVTGTLMLTLVIRSAASQEFNPVLGASTVSLAILVQMGLFVWFLYSVIQQMRPEVIITEIHDGTHQAYKRHVALLRRVHAHSLSGAPDQTRVMASDNGFVVEINMKKLAKCFEGCGDDLEVTLHGHIGDYISYYDNLATVRSSDRAEAGRIGHCVAKAYRLNSIRTIDADPSYGLEEMEMIAWTEVSTAKHNPETGLMVLHALKDLVTRWSQRSDAEIQPPTGSEDAKLPVVYEPEPAIGQAADILQSLATVSSESLQHQIFTEVINVISAVYPHLGSEARARTDDTLRRILTAMGDHVPTRDLDVALQSLVQALHALGSDQVAEMVEDGREQLVSSVGTVASRSSRLEKGSGDGPAAKHSQEELRSSETSRLGKFVDRPK